MPLDLPAQPGASRDAAILERVRSGDFALPFAPLPASAGGHSAVFAVSSDALSIDGVRVNVSASLQQSIADALGCSLLTARLADMIWAARSVTVPPLPRAITATTAAMVDQSARIDAAVAAAGGARGGIVQSVGKHWVIDNLLADHPGRAVNYGWHFEGPAFEGKAWDACVSGAGCRLIQGRGWAHSAAEVDYSQVCMLVARACFVDGAPADLHDVLQTPGVCALASAQGVVRVLRQPSVPVADPAFVLAPSRAGFVPVSYAERAPVAGSGSGLLIAAGIAAALAAGVALVTRGSTPPRTRRAR